MVDLGFEFWLQRTVRSQSETVALLYGMSWVRDGRAWCWEQRGDYHTILDSGY